MAWALVRSSPAIGSLLQNHLGSCSPFASSDAPATSMAFHRDESRNAALSDAE